MPNSIPPSDLPFFGNFTGQAAYGRQQGSDLDIVTRSYTMRLFVAELGQGIPGEIERLCEPFFESVRDKFDGLPRLDNLNGVRDAKILSDSGAGVLQYAGETFIGIEFKLQVIEEAQITYAANN